ncbi:hypothetical protein BH23CHL5_BH23CHL5_10560 [soil metagenome]
MEGSESTSVRLVDGSDPPPLIDTARVLDAIRHRWWLVVLAPTIALITFVVWMRFEPYSTSVRAVVVIPGDTEIPGNAERPELMVLDDLPLFVNSRAFAEGVHVVLQRADLDIESVQSSLDGRRYSRVLTISVSAGNREEVSDIADAVADSLPGLVNEYLVGEDGAPATVRIIDPPGEPERDRENALLKGLVVGVTALLMGVAFATLAGPRNQTLV